MLRPCSAILLDGISGIFSVCMTSTCLHVCSDSQSFRFTILLDQISVSKCVSIHIKSTMLAHFDEMKILIPLYCSLLSLCSKTFTAIMNKAGTSQIIFPKRNDMTIMLFLNGFDWFTCSWYKPYFCLCFYHKNHQNNQFYNISRMCTLCQVHHLIFRARLARN